MVRSSLLCLGLHILVADADELCGGGRACPASDAAFDDSDATFALLQTSLHQTEVVSGIVNETHVGSNSASSTREHDIALEHHLHKAAKKPVTGAVLVDDDRWKWDIHLVMAIVFVGMVASTPLVVLHSGGEELTAAWIGLSGSLFVWLTLGIYLFTCQLPFSSGHFVEETRLLTLPEVTYFMAQVMTTVGYGDVVPATELGKVVVALYILTAVFVIVSTFTEMQELMHAALISDEEQIEATESVRLLSLDIKEDARFVSWDSLLQKKKRLLRKRIAAWALVASTGVAFFHLYPGEEKPLLDAVYMSVITLSTVGFGVVTPMTEAGMIFGAFWMVFGSAALGAAVTALGEVLTVMKHKEVHEHHAADAEKLEEHLENIPTDKEGRLEKAEFYRFALLQSGAVTESQLDALDAQFKELGGDCESNKLPLDSLKARLHLKAEEQEDGSLGSASAALRHHRSAALFEAKMNVGTRSPKRSETQKGPKGSS